MELAKKMKSVFVGVRLPQDIHGDIQQEALQRSQDFSTILRGRIKNASSTSSPYDQTQLLHELIHEVQELKHLLVPSDVNREIKEIKDLQIKQNEQLKELISSWQLMYGKNVKKIEQSVVTTENEIKKVMFASEKIFEAVKKIYHLTKKDQSPT